MDKYMVITMDGTFEGKYEHLKDAKAHVREHDLDAGIFDIETEKYFHYNREIATKETREIEYEIDQTLLGYPVDEEEDN